MGSRVRVKTCISCTYFNRVIVRKRQCSSSLPKSFGYTNTAQLGGMNLWPLNYQGPLSRAPGEPPLGSECDRAEKATSALPVL